MAESIRITSEVVLSLQEVLADLNLHLPAPNSPFHIAKTRRLKIDSKTLDELAETWTAEWKGRTEDIDAEFEGHDSNDDEDDGAMRPDETRSKKELEALLHNIRKRQEARAADLVTQNQRTAEAYWSAQEEYKKELFKRRQSGFSPPLCSRDERITMTPNHDIRYAKYLFLNPRVNSDNKKIISTGDDSCIFNGGDEGDNDVAFDGDANETASSLQLNRAATENTVNGLRTYNRKERVTLRIYSNVLSPMHLLHLFTLLLTRALLLSCCQGDTSDRNRKVAKGTHQKNAKTMRTSSVLAPMISRMVCYISILLIFLRMKVLQSSSV